MQDLHGLHDVLPKNLPIQRNYRKKWIWKVRYLLLKILLLLDPHQKMARRPRGVFKAVKVLILPRQMVGEIGLQKERRTQFYLHW